MTIGIAKGSGKQIIITYDEPRELTNVFKKKTLIATMWLTQEKCKNNCPKQGGGKTDNRTKQ